MKTEFCTWRLTSDYMHINESIGIRVSRSRPRERKICRVPFIQWKQKVLRKRECKNGQSCDFACDFWRCSTVFHSFDFHSVLPQCHNSTNWCLNCAAAKRKDGDFVSFVRELEAKDNKVFRIFERAVSSIAANCLARLPQFARSERRVLYCARSQCHLCRRYILHDTRCHQVSC